MAASGVRPRLSASDSRINTSAAAPSEIELELAAVTVPSFAKAGLSVGIFAASAVSGCSSCTTSTAPFRPGALTATISGAKLPSSTAFFARFSDSIA